jgi:glycosyltransferase involved in cell wall biosynthesis
LRILVITSSFPRFPGDSSGIFILNLCKELQKLGIEIEILAPHDYRCSRHEFWEGIEIFRFPYFYPPKLQRLCYGAGIPKNMQQSTLALMQPPFFLLAELFYALRISQKRKFDLVHAHWSIPQGVVGLILQGLCRIPCVTSLHGSDVYGLRAPVLRRLNARVILGSRACTANSKATAERARNISGRKDIEIIPMGVDIELFSRARFQETLHDPPEKKDEIILYAGRLIDCKGVDYLIKALPNVLEKQPEAKLLIVGSGPAKNDLLRLSERLNLQEKVLFLGAVSQEELAGYYSMADVFVLPSVVTDAGETEGLGVVLLEAMACGLPVIGSVVGGIPDIIEDGETGLLAQQKNPGDLAEKINRVLANKSLRQCLSKSGHDFVWERFSWSSIAKRYLEVFRTVSEKKGMLAGENASRS